MKDEMKELVEQIIKEFYEKYTDGVDEENGYYDSQFEGTQPKTVESFIHKVIDSAYRRGVEDAEKAFQEVRKDNPLTLDSAEDGRYTYPIREREYFLRLSKLGGTNE